MKSHNSLLDIFRDVWEVTLRRNKTFNEYLCFTMFIASFAVCMICINDYNPLALFGWIGVTSYWFFEIAKLNVIKNENRN